MFRKAVIALSFSVAACSASGPHTATLYRNSPIDPSMRLHFATFDADESDSTYNSRNCAMAARLLNANVTALAKREGKARDLSVGFWCESGAFRAEGHILRNFPGSFPTDVH